MRQLRTLAALTALVLVAQAGASSYTLRLGDTLSRVAARFGVSVRDLAAANNIRDPDFVRAGRTLSVPSGGRGSGAPAAGGTGVHVVRRGETLIGIASRYGTKTSTLRSLNGLKGDLIRIGQRLAVPGGFSYRCPVAGFNTVVANFGDPRPGRRQHQGNDVYARRGTPVVAPIGGTLRLVRGSIAGFAFYLDGDDGTTYYGSHMDRWSRGEGRVAAGQQIGTVGDTGNARGLGAHLHFEIKPGGGASVNPARLLNAWCR